MQLIRTPAARRSRRARWAAAVLLAFAAACPAGHTLPFPLNAKH